ncbi:MAG: NAD-dependent epimerase/dehydratase family protein [Gemmatimonadota bacterium]
MPDDRLIALTGSSGFVGGHLRRALLDGGMQVRSLVRRPAAGESEISVGDFQDRGLLSQALAGVETVVHLAARVHVMTETSPDAAAEYRDVNVTLTRSLLAAAGAAGVRHFVFASSVKVMGETNEAPWTEESPAAPADPYGISKLEAERLIQREARRFGMRATILRFPLVYGPGNRGNMLRLFRLVERGLPLPFGSVGNRRSLAYVGNVVAAFEAVLAAPLTGQEIFFVSDGEDLSTPELLRLIGRGLGRSVHLVSIPPALLVSLAAAGDRILGSRPAPRLAPAVERLVRSLRVDSSKLTRLSGHRPPWTPSEGLAETGRWYLEQRRKALV